MAAQLTVQPKKPKPEQPAALKPAEPQQQYELEREILWAATDHTKARLQAGAAARMQEWRSMHAAELWKAVLQTKEPARKQQLVFRRAVAAAKAFVPVASIGDKRAVDLITKI